MQAGRGKNRLPVRNITMKPTIIILVLLLFSCSISIIFSCDKEQEDDGDEDDNNENELDDDDTSSDDDDYDSSLNCDGEVCTDESSGLMWQNGDESNFEWVQAKSYCQDLDWGGYSDWRLPTISELRTLIRGCSETETGGPCGITDSCLNSDDCWNKACTGCTGWGGPGPGGYYRPGVLTGDGWRYWSSSADLGMNNFVYGVDIDYPQIIIKKGQHDNARCVR